MASSLFLGGGGGGGGGGGLVMATHGLMGWYSFFQRILVMTQAFN